MGIRRVPWDVVREVIFQSRKAFFSVERPIEKTVVAEETVDKLEDVFRKENYREGWLVSYSYMGEDANMCRAEYEDDKWEDYQHHIRLFERADGKTLIHTHYELDPLKHPKEHIAEVNLNTEKGVEMVGAALDQHKIEYTVK